MTDDSLLARLAEEFIAGIRSGKTPDPEEYAIRYPQLAIRIRELFPTLMMLESAAGAKETGFTQQVSISPGAIFGPYRIIREIGRGSMGIVYEAVKVAIERRVALKILPLQRPVDAHIAERFFREARITADLKHPNIVPIYDVGQVGDTGYFAMQYIEGRSLDRILRLMHQQPHSQSEPSFSLDSRSYRISPDGAEAVGDVNSISSAARRNRAGVPARFDDYLKWVVNLGIQAASGLAYAHQQKLVHRDIKPSNLLLGKNGVLRIADFGLARRLEDPTLTKTGLLLGTPRYMSPEQAEAAKRQVDHRSDIYSLGATLYELLTCRPVFEGNTPQEILLQILVSDPVSPRHLNPSIPIDLETVVMKAMARRPEDRYRSALDFADDLKRWLKMEPVKAKRIGPVHRSLAWCRRNLRYASVMAALVLALTVVGSLYYKRTVGEQSENSHKEEQHIGAEPTNPLAEDRQAIRFPGPTISKDAIADGILKSKAETQTSLEIGEIENQSQREKNIQELSFSQTEETSSDRSQSPGKNIPSASTEQTAPPIGQAISGLPTTTLHIRLGTTAPSNTVLYEILKYIKQDWERISNGNVKVTIFADGVLGDGPEMLGQMRAGKIQAVALSSVGLSRIDNSIACLQIPMMFRSYAELDYVRDHIGPRLGKKLEERGFKLVNWGDAGWIHTFAKNSIRTPDELRNMKLFTSVGDPEGEKLWRSLGFRVVPLSLRDMIASLQIGMIDASNLTPIYAYSTGAYRQAPYMIGTKWMPLVAATIIDLKVWEKLPEKHRPLMLEAARKATDQFRSEIRQMDEGSILKMQENGLKVIRLDADTLAIWQREAENAYLRLRGRYTPAELFDEVQRLRDEFRTYNNLPLGNRK